MSSTIDFSRPLSDVLRECTKEAHENIEASAAATALLSGKVTKEEYIRFLMMLWHVYAALELALEKHATNTVLEPTYNPPLLERAPALSSDISHLLQVPEDSWKAHPIHTSLLATAPEGLTDYVNRIHELSDSKDPSALLAHAYVRYLGDLSGGQTIRHTIAKAYDLDEASGQGLSFYAFKELKSSKSANQGEMKRIKDWFRAGMNVGAGDNAELKASIAAEANRVFHLNGGLFNAMLQSELDQDKLLKSEEPPILITPPARSGDKGYSVASVAAIIAAVSVAHFALTVGGFTGDRGYDKLVTVEQWLDSLWRAIIRVN
ncbi:heme oxygenase [Moniliophthora roreri MCA 2997]|uniref:Heme oxygenase n=2 Tax=Moniliophthora roreri TaxID=221103 RepID=V2WUH4_MONRO|nr:heme oxygenase [Moniliophthora roreri MCA 2997]KAI3617992.1 heme oxygenase [Moniliophthora roreri]